MEGIYFFGEHIRWNLGWSNPNQAGAFMAMWIPWLWGLGRLAATRPSGSWPSWPTLLAEMALWFLLCKTYSRGALLAAGVAGMAFFVWGRISRTHKADWKLAVARLAGIGVLLVATGFFARVDPRFVAQDASAGNRLTLWKGGVQMIAVSPWKGWGAGNSGSGFMHWFQPLDATERYAGMVNSYLHVGVEYGLPVLAVAVALVAGVAMLGFAVGMSAGCGHLGASLAAAAAGASLVAFLVANGFSTLWIFSDLWWLPGFSAVAIMAACFAVAGALGWRMIGRTGMVAGGLSAAGAVALFGLGKALRGEVKVERNSSGVVTVRDRAAAPTGAMLIFPDRGVLGDDWGKEIRRMAVAEPFRGFEIEVGEMAGGFFAIRSPKWIVACGARSGEGFEALRRFPGARLVLLHPVGKPELPETATTNVSAILPMLDTRGGGRRWRSACGKRGWKCRTSPGVGQDVRLAWPGVLEDFIGRTN